MKKLLLLLLALLTFLPAFAEAGGARLTLKEWSYDAGEVREGEVIEKVITVFNEGEQVLHIKDVNSE
jgi:hypothetical protein